MNIMEYMFDQDNITRLYGIEQMNIGRREGREEGKEEEKKATASNLLALNMDILILYKKS